MPRPKRAPAGQAPPAQATKLKAAPHKRHAAAQGVSDALRQAVKDLGGDDADLDLIAGVDSDDDEVSPSKDFKGKGKGKSDEKDLKKALGDFMKGLDFGAVRPGGDVAEGEEEDEEDDSDEEEEDDEEEEQGDSEEDEEEDEESSEEEEVSTPAPAPVKKAAAETKTVKAVEPKAVKVAETKAKAQPEVDMTSGKNVPAAPLWPSLLPALDTSKPLAAPNPTQLSNLRQRANQLLSTLPPIQRSNNSDAAFLQQILSSGTHQDKLSALVLIVRESPIHAVRELEKLRAMAGWKDGAPSAAGNRSERVATMRALADWWVGGGGKEAGKLRYFADQPLLTHPQLSDRHLVVYAFEDLLKKWFFNLLQILEALSHDTLPYVRVQALTITFQLLAGNAEQEQNLLRLSVNKLGDTDKSVASKTSYLLLQLLQAHPAMNAVVAREISALVLKTSATASTQGGSHVRFDDDKKAPAPKSEVNNHGRYYGLLTLNQLTLTSKDKEVAGRLVELYFEVFREVLGDRDEEDDKVEEADELGGDQIEKVAGKIGKWQGRRKGAKPKGGRKAPDAEEFVESSEAKLVAAVLTGINRALPFAKIDDDVFAKYMDTLFKITHTSTFNTSIQALTLIFHVSRARQTVSDRFYRALYETVLDNRLLTSSKQAMFLNLLFKALKADKSLNRVMAFVKRLLQALNLHQPPFICGALYLLGELFDVTPGLKRMLIEPEDDGEEHFVDAPEDGEGPKAESSQAAAKSKQKTYDGRAREPQYAHADTSCLWELIPFLNHFHPSVSLQASQLLLSQPLTGSPDISLNSLISFLDRFVYRNPKQHLQPKGASIMQPAAAADRAGVTVTRTKGPRMEGSAGFVNDEQFWRKKVEDVPVDQLFFHRYFTGKKEIEARRKKGKKAGDEDDEDDEDVDVDEDADAENDEDEEADSDAEEADADEQEDDEDESDPEEAEIWKAMKASMPSAGDDMGLSDVSDSEGDVDYSDDDEDVEGTAVDEADEREDDASASDDEADEAVSDASDDSEPFPDFDEDDDDLIPLDDMPDVVLDGGASEPETDDADTVAGAKRKRNAERKEQRKKKKQMPLFASADDYAAMIDAAPSEED
ncbi:RNA-binding ribosome biosynthesis protein mak21 [Cryptotrichosporon argae]